MVSGVTVAAVWQALTADPVLFYSACAATLLGVVSLGTGLWRGDLVVLAHPRQALRVLGAVLLAGLLIVAADYLTRHGAEPWLGGSARALARVPIYVATLALGPSVGLACGVLFAAATAGNAFPGPSEALFTFELVVLGWLAIYPSPRTARWAGPFDVIVARTLTWGTAGVFWLALEGEDVTLATLVNASSRWPWGLAVAAVALLAMGPRAYAAVFPRSRIAPTPERPVAAGAPAAPAERALEPPGELETLAAGERRVGRGHLLAPRLDPDDPNA